MADNLTDYEERRLLDLSIVSGSVYVALFTVAPTDAGGGTEVSSGGYTRQAYTAAAATTDGSSVTSKANNATITFPKATANWGTIVAYAIFDAQTGGNMRWQRTLMSAEQREIKTGDQPSFEAGALTFSIA